jgi:levansucrase
MTSGEGIARARADVLPASRSPSAADADTPPPPYRWSAPGVDLAGRSVAPVIVGRDVVRVSPDLDIWDAWPIQADDGRPAVLAGGGTLWMALGAPRFEDPDARHAHARIHLLARDDDAWHPLGPAMADGFSPGSREWSGSAVLDADGATLTLYFTATGRRGEAQPSFEQRIMQARATLRHAAGTWSLADWRGLTDAVARDPAHYQSGDAGTGRVGTIKAFRDPAYFRDPADGRRYLFICGSRADAASAYNGVVGAAVAAPEGEPHWSLLPPLVDATGANNELERPHMLMADGLYYLFWSTQAHVFDPDGPGGPTGLYAVVADRPTGPFRPVNGTGLVFANPPEAPRQAYSWLVLPDRSVISFVDDWGPGADRPRRFGATFAPALTLAIDGDRVRLASP